MENSRDLFTHEQIPAFLQPYSFIHDTQLSRCVQTAPFPADIHSTAFRSLHVLFPRGDAFLARIRFVDFSLMGYLS